MSGHPAKCGCQPCKDRRRRQYIKNYYRKLPPDKRNTLTMQRRAKQYGVRSEPYSRTEIMNRWARRCCYCDAWAAHLDHVHPLSKGGADEASNIVPACASCNLSKGAKTLAEWAETFGTAKQCDRLTHNAAKATKKGLPWNS